MAKRAPQLSDEQLTDLLALVEDADSVELKLTVPESDQRSAIGALDLDPLDAEIRQVFFFETPDLALFDAGVVARARRVQRKGDDSVVKLRPVVPSELPADFRQSPNMVVEVDAMPGGFVCSGSLKRALGTSTRVREAAKGERKISKLFSKEQRAFFTANAPDGIELDDLAIFGPIFVLKLKSRPPATSESSSPSCGCIRTTRASSSSRSSAPRRRRSMSRPARERFFMRTASRSPVSSRPRRRPR